MTIIIIAIGIILTLISIILGVLGYLQARAWKVDRQSTIDGMNELYREELTRKNKKKQKQNPSKKEKEAGKINKKLHDAGLNISTTMFIGIAATAAVVGCVFITGIFQTVVVGIIGGIVILLGFYFWLGLKSKSHRTLFDEQFGGILPQIAESIRSGLTIERAIRSITEHTDDPIREQFRRVNSEVAYGVPLSEALLNMSERTGNEDVKMLAIAITIQKSGGGHLSESIESIAETVQQRLKTRRMVRAETSDARMSLKVCAGMPPLVLIIMCSSNSASAEFYTQPIGWVVIGVCVVLEILGIIVMNNMMNIKAR